MRPERAARSLGRSKKLAWRFAEDYGRRGMSPSASHCAACVLVGFGCVGCNSEDAVIALFSNGSGGTGDVAAASTTSTTAISGSSTQGSTASGGSSSSSGSGGSSGTGGGTIGVAGAPSTDVACPCADGDFIAPEEVTEFDDAIAWFSPALSTDLLTLYIAGHNGLVESIYTTTRPDRCSFFETPVPVASINTAGSNGTPALSPDGLELYYYSDRVGSVGGRDVWVSRRESPGADFGEAQNVPSTNTVDTDHLARLSWDQLALFFTSTRPGGGVEDIFVATRATLDETFTNPTRVAELNHPGNDSGAALAEDGLTVYFASNRSGSWDLFRATRPERTAPFSAPTALSVANTGEIELDPVVSRDHQELFFTSFVTGTARIWRSVRACE